MLLHSLVKKSRINRSQSITQGELMKVTQMLEHPRANIRGRVLPLKTSNSFRSLLMEKTTTIVLSIVA
jgi:hypothetical protein